MSDNPIPFFKRNKGLEPQIDREGSKISPERLLDVKSGKDLPVYERLFQHATMSSARRKANYRPPANAPRDDLDFVMEAVFDPTKTLFPEKGDPYLHTETVFSESDPRYDSWRVLRNRYIVIPPKKPDRGHPIVFGGVKERESLFHVKLGISSYHSPQTNPGYSRAPSGAFYAI